MTPAGERERFAARPASERVFFCTMAAILAVVVAAGFAPTFFARGLTAAGPLPTPLLVHGVFGTAWVVLFAAQAGLVAAHRLRPHRRLGWVGAALAVGFVASGVGVVAALERSHGAEPLAWRAPHIFTNAAPLAAFAVLVAAGIWQRSSAARHKRLMLLAAVVLLPPALGRLFAQLEVSQLNFAAFAAFAFANACFDLLVHRRAHLVSLLGAAALVALDAITTLWLAAVGS